MLIKVLPVFLFLLGNIISILGYTLIDAKDVDIPKPDEVAKMARYIVHNSDWASIATISTLPDIKSFPFASVKSLSDGPTGNSTGKLYFYFSVQDVSVKDLLVDRRITVMATLAESDYCSQNNFDPQDPRCAKVILSGNMYSIPKESEEYDFAQYSLFERHPAMKYWPSDHNWFIGTVDIKSILVLDFFGGIRSVSVEEYFSVSPTFYSVKYIKLNFLKK